MKITKEQIVGFTSSAILCLIIVLILSLIFLQTEMKAQEEGVLVSFGTVDLAAGTFTPRTRGTNRDMATDGTVPSVNRVEHSKVPPVITQDNEPSVAVDSPDKKLAEEQRRRAEEQRRREAINQQMAGAFGGGNTSTGSEGAADSGAGKQGSPQGNAAVGSYSGIGGSGSFDLAGRSLGEGGLQRPAYAVQEEGTIVVEITVDPNGNVINAEIRLRGTNIENSSMRRSALDAARKTRFNIINGIQNQIGTITYRFTLK
jgi:TonB family protein